MSVTNGDFRVLAYYTCIIYAADLSVSIKTTLNRLVSWMIKFSRKLCRAACITTRDKVFKLAPKLHLGKIYRKQRCISCHDLYFVND